MCEYPMHFDIPIIIRDRINVCAEFDNRPYWFAGQGDMDSIQFLCPPSTKQSSAALRACNTETQHVTCQIDLTCEIHSNPRLYCTLCFCLVACRRFKCTKQVAQNLRVRTNFRLTGDQSMKPCSHGIWSFGGHCLHTNLTVLAGQGVYIYAYIHIDTGCDIYIHIYVYTESYPDINITIYISVHIYI